MDESTIKMCCSVRVGGNNPKSVRWNDEVKAAVRGKEAAWKEVLAGTDGDAKKQCLYYEEEKRKVKRCIYQSKMKVSEQF